MGAYKCDVVAEMKMGPYIHGVLILCACLLSRFYGILVAMCPQCVMSFVSYFGCYGFSMQELIVVLAWCSVTHCVLMCGDSICTFLRIMVISVTSHDCISLVPRPSPVPVFDRFAYCKRSKTGAGEGLGTRLDCIAERFQLLWNV